jgi:hypothetical protein
LALLLVTRFARRERGVWFPVGAALVWTVATTPQATWLVAALGAVTLGLHAFRRPTWREVTSASPGSRGPYRAPEATPGLPPRTEVVFAPAPVAARRRLLTGAATAVYLSLWTAGWTGDAWPPHLLALDLVATAAVVIGLVRARLREPLVPLGATYAHHLVAAGWVSLPATRLGWGLSTVSAGFALLLASLVIAYRLRPHPEATTSYGKPPRTR